MCFLVKIAEHNEWFVIVERCNVYHCVNHRSFGSDLRSVLAWNVHIGDSLPNLNPVVTAETLQGVGLRGQKKIYENKTETIAERDTLIGQRESLSNRQVFLETALLNTYFDASSFFTTEHCSHYYRYETWSEWIDDYNIRFVCFLFSLF